MAVGLKQFVDTEEYQISKNNKLELENKYSKTIEHVEENELPQINKNDLTIAIAGVPFSFLLILASVLLSVAIGIGIIWLIYYIEASLFHRVHVGIIAMIAIGILIAICVSLKSVILAFLNKSIFELSAVLPNEDTQVRRDILEVCKKLKIDMPDNILLSFKPTFYVTEAPIITLNGKFKGRSLIVGMPYLRYLNNNEFKSVISHEMAHFTGKDTVFSIFVSPLYASIRRIIGILNQYSEGESTGSIAMYLPMLPLIWILAIFFNWYAKLESKISRQREMRADYIATLLYGKENFKNALTKVSNLGSVFSNTYPKEYIEILKVDKMFKNYFSYFESNIDKNNLNNDDLLSDITDEYSSHCSIKDRFEYIPNICDNNESAIYNMDDYLKIEEYLTESMGLYLMRIASIQRVQQQPENQES